jgi:soluble lytic murein transglycosylase-like protein/tetratricopeptide (TPR) repeat protein
VRLFGEGDLPAALHQLRGLLGTRGLAEEDRHRAHFLRAWINDRLGHFQQASASFFRVRKLDEHPLREMAAFFEARADLLRGHLRTAIAECDRYISDYPEGRYRDECHLVQADAYLGLGSRATALHRYQEFLSSHPDDQRREELRLKIAEALEQAGELDRAAAQYRSLYLSHRLPTTGLAAEAGLRRITAGGLELEPLSDDQLFVRACTLRDSGEIEDSYELFCDLTERHPDRGSASSALGSKLASERHDFLWRNRRFEEVGEWSAAAYEADPSRSTAAEHLYWAVQGLSRAGRFSEAVRYQEIGRKRFPSHRRFRSSHERTALLHVGAGNYRQARGAYQRWQSASSRARRSSKVRFFTAYYAYRAGLWEEGRAGLEELSVGRSRYATAARYYLGKTLRRLGRRAEANEHFAGILKDKPDSWYSLVLRSKERQRAGLPGGLFHRDGRWPGASGRESLSVPSARRASLQQSLVRLYQRARPGLRGPSDPGHRHGEVVRDADGHPLQSESRPGWADPKLLAIDDPAQDAEPDPAPPAAATPTATADVLHRAGRPPATWTASTLWNPERGWQLWTDFVAGHQVHWPELPAAYELSRIGLGELAGPLLSQVYREVRDTRRKRSVRRKVRRWKSSRGRRGGEQVARWAAILELGLSPGDWRDLFAAAGYPASVSAFANQETEYDQVPRVDADARAAWTLIYPAAFAPHVWQAAWENDVDPLLVLSVMRAESLFRHDAVSRVGALGLVQVMPATGARVAALMGEQNFRVEKLLEPETNIRVGTFYLGKLLDRFAGQFPLAVGAYNGGPHNIGRWLRAKQGIPLEEFIEEIAFDETRNYIKKVIRYYGIYIDLYGRGSAVQLPAATRPDDASAINF